MRGWRSTHFKLRSQRNNTEEMGASLKTVTSTVWHPERLICSSQERRSNDENCFAKPPDLRTLRQLGNRSSSHRIDWGESVHVIERLKGGSISGYSERHRSISSGHHPHVHLIKTTWSFFRSHGSRSSCQTCSAHRTLGDLLVRRKVLIRVLERLNS